MATKSISHNKFAKTLKDYTLMTFFTWIIVIGTYFFKFPNNFTIGGVSGLSVVVAQFTPLTPSAWNFVFNMALVVIGFIFLGRDFGAKTVYVSILMSVSLWAMDFICPMTTTLTDNKMLELIFATVLPGLGSALLFNMGSSSGGTDVVAMILKKRSSLNIGRALFVCDALITLTAFFVFDIETFLFSVVGLAIKSLIIDIIIDNINISKVFNVICTDPEPISDYIVNKLHRSATIVKGTGAYSGNDKYIIYTAMKGYQAVLLRQYIRENQSSAFILVTNTSEIFGRGFSRGV